MIQKRDSKGSTPSDNRRNRLFSSKESASPNPGGTVDAGAQSSSPSPAATMRGTQGVVPTIGATMTIRGDLVGKEDVMVRGKLEGNVILNDNDVVIDESGQIEGSIIAKHVLVRGGVNGEIQGLEKITIAATGRVQGTIAAPRVVLEEGGKFKGMVDMPLDEQAAGSAAGKPQELNPAASKRVAAAEVAASS